LATKRLRYLIATLVAAFTLAAAGTATAATSPSVHVRVEGRSSTIIWTTTTPFTGTVLGQPLNQPTALGALIAGANAANVPLGLQNFDCCGLFVNSINGTAGNATHYWAFKVGNTLSSVGAASVAATSGMKVLFYYTTSDPVTFATQPTLAISDNASTVKKGSTVTVKVRAYDDAGKGTLRSGAQIWVGGAKVALTSANGTARIKLTSKGKVQIRATYPGEIRSNRLWVRVN
jgi:Domain of unknown function (DUF4430)